MPRRMSCALTIDQVRNQTKTVTRRHVDTWKTLQIGDRLTLIEKGMGLPKGARQVVLAEVEAVEVARESLSFVDQTDLVAEGFPDADPIEWARWWADSHGYKNTPLPKIPCRRIEWRYLTESETT